MKIVILLMVNIGIFLQDVTLTPETTIMPRTELQVFDVTDNSVRLSWASSDSLKPHVYELSVISLADGSLVLKQNVSSTERLIGGLASGQMYQVIITGQHKSLGLVTYQATFTTSKSLYSCILFFVELFNRDQI